MSAEEAAAQPLQLDIFQYVRSAQSQFGLKHADYHRYRKHCCNRILKLRCHLKFHHGRHRYQKKELKVELVKDNRWLELLLLQAERAWATAHELKVEMDKDGFVHTNKRRHMLRRFSKASTNAAQLVQLAEETADAHTVAQCVAYSDLLQGLELFEKDTDALTSAGRLLRARKALRVLAGIGSPAVRSAARAKVTEVDAVLRLVLHRAGQEEGGAVSEADVPLPGGSDSGAVEARLRALAASTHAAAPAADAVTTFSWSGIDFKVHDARVGELLAKADAALEAPEGAMDVDGGDGKPSDAMVQRIAAQDAAVAALRAAKEALDVAAEGGAGADDGGNGGHVQQELHAAVTAALTEALIQRYSLQAQQVNLKFQRNALHAISRAKGRERGARPEDAIRLYDGLHKAALELEAAAKLDGMPPAAVQRLVTASAALAALFAAARCYYIAHLRLARDEAEVAYALLRVVLHRLDEARALAGGLEGGLPAVQAELLQHVHDEAAAYAVVSHAQAAARADKDESGLAADMQGIALAGKRSKSATANTEFIAEHMDEWKSFVTMPACKSQLFRLNSLFQTVPMRPITLDTALHHVTEPDVAHRCPQQEAGERPSVLQGLKSLFSFR